MRFLLNLLMHWYAITVRKTCECTVHTLTSECQTSTGSDIPLSSVTDCPLTITLLSSGTEKKLEAEQDCVIVLKPVRKLMDIIKALLTCWVMCSIFYGHFVDILWTFF